MPRVQAITRTEALSLLRSGTKIFMSVEFLSPQTAAAFHRQTSNQYYEPSRGQQFAFVQLSSEKELTKTELLFQRAGSGQINSPEYYKVV